MIKEKTIKITQTENLTKNFIWSKYQKDIFKDIAKGNGHTYVHAYAGAAKTTSIIESFKYVPKGKKVLALAFNKLIQVELKNKSPHYVDALTFHSLGFRAIRQKFGNIEVNENKTYNIIKKITNDKDIISSICDTISYCKYGLLDTSKQIQEIINNFDIDTGEMEDNEFIALVIKVLSECKTNTHEIDFNDMCWFPFVYNMHLGYYDYIYIDEVQDLNKAQMVMAKKACNPNDGRIIAVGDMNQAIYSWRLSDTSILEWIKSQDKSKTLPLPISYRCPKNVINLAKYWVEDIECPDEMIGGTVEYISYNKMYEIAKPGCFILSRLNAPLIKICLTFIKNGIKSNIRGRDIGMQLNSLIKKSKKKQISAFLTWISDWKNKEIKKLKSRNVNTDNVSDRYECLIALCEECKSISELNKKINDLFSDNDESKVIIL